MFFIQPWGIDCLLEVSRVAILNLVVAALAEVSYAHETGNNRLNVVEQGVIP
jgi:hypothetical protein